MNFQTITNVYAFSPLNRKIWLYIVELNLKRIHYQTNVKIYVAILPQARFEEDRRCPK